MKLKTKRTRAVDNLPFATLVIGREMDTDQFEVWLVYMGTEQLVGIGATTDKALDSAKATMQSIIDSLEHLRRPQ